MSKSFCATLSHINDLVGDDWWVILANWYTKQAGGALIAPQCWDEVNELPKRGMPLIPVCSLARLRQPFASMTSRR